MIRYKCYGHCLKDYGIFVIDFYSDKFKGPEIAAYHVHVKSNSMNKYRVYKSGKNGPWVYQAPGYRLPTISREQWVKEVKYLWETKKNIEKFDEKVKSLLAE